MQDENKNIVLSTNDLSTGYLTKKSESVISNHINIAIQKGLLVGIVGTNGIGKSTLLRTLGKMQPLLHGVVSIKNKKLKEYTSFGLAEVMSIVLTEAPASQNLTVLELVSLGRQPYTNWLGTLNEKDKECILNALALTDTEKLKNKKCFELSDGQKQRVMIARALAQDTEIILLDEPTTHLDLYHRAYILKLLKKLTKDTGKTILYSTHEIDLAIQLSDKMIVMTPNLVHFDTPKNLIESDCFQTLFPENIIEFEKNTGRFIIK
jgi:iron complex transport system ATP-binding protein